MARASQIVLQFDKEGSTSTPSNTGDTNLTHRYLWGTGVDQILADEQVHYDWTPEDYITDALLWPLGEHLGSVRDAVDNSGVVRIHRAYDAYGNITSEELRNSANQVVQPGQPFALEHLFAFTARPFDADTLLQNNLNRWYDATVGRWLSEDPIGNWGGMNLYEYVGDAPTRASDPMGMQNAGQGIYPGPLPGQRPVPGIPPPQASPRPAPIVGPHGPVEWNPPDALLTPSQRCPSMGPALEIANEVMNQGECEEWFDDRVKCHGASPPDSYDIWVVPFIIYPPGASLATIPWLGNNIYVSEKMCNQPVGVLATLLIHEVAHHYCPGYGEAGEKCAQEGQEACSNQAMDAAIAGGHSGFPGPAPPRPNPWDLPGHPVPWEPKY